ncbi:MAG: response regulator [Verrucomicrobia bacterium]|jgi:CheY-like chemotaxis protein|nr:response regulator [Verrucomicrobiota bacterium]
MSSETVREAGILVVDDDAEARETLMVALPLFGFERIFQASDGLAGLACLEQHPDDIEIVITDFRMPRMDGLEMTRRMAQRGGLPVGILMMTAFDVGNVEKEFLAVASPAVLPLALLHKPYSIASVVKALNDAIPVIRARREGRDPS